MKASAQSTVAAIRSDAHMPTLPSDLKHISLRGPAPAPPPWDGALPPVDEIPGSPSVAANATNDDAASAAPEEPPAPLFDPLPAFEDLRPVADEGEGASARGSPHDGGAAYTRDDGGDGDRAGRTDSEAMSDNASDTSWSDVDGYAPRR